MYERSRSNNITWRPLKKCGSLTLCFRDLYIKRCTSTIHWNIEDIKSPPVRHNGGSHIVRKVLTVHITPPTLSASASKERHFQTHPSFWPYLVPIKISWWYLKRFKNYRTDKHTHKQTLMKTIPPSLHCRSTGGRNTKSLQTYKSIGYAMLCYSLIKT